ncbi:MAG: hypothetical protein JW913_02055 [Chitinispirillaceae bacterium]|nr:hypothetical protein [Chitinispirillaceae bacterium]
MDMHELKVRLMAARIDRRQLTHELGISYSMLSSYLGGFSRMPDRIYRRIVEILAYREETATIKQVQG